METKKYEKKIQKYEEAYRGWKSNSTATLKHVLCGGVMGAVGLSLVAIGTTALTNYNPSNDLEGLLNISEIMAGGALMYGTVKQAYKACRCSLKADSCLMQLMKE